MSRRAAAEKPYKKFPFFMSREYRKLSMTNQLVDQVRKSIDSGHYRPGDYLPSLRKAASDLGVSLIVVRQAMARLEDMGVVAARRGIGYEVLDRRGAMWRGRVLFVTPHGVVNMHVDFVGDVVRRRLLAAGYAFSQLNVPRGRNGRYDISLLEAMLKEPISLVIHMFSVPALEKCTVKADVDALMVTLPGDKVVVPRGTAVRFVNDAAVPDLVRRCVEARVGSVLQVGFSPGFADASEELRRAGIAVRCEYVGGQSFGNGAMEAVKRDTHRLIGRLLTEEKALPDLIYFSDDHAAEAGLMALALHGVRVPEDVKVASFANRGIAPTYPKEVTRMEIDPEESGERIADCALAILSGERPAGLSLVPRYVQGETL